jgi:hypothetical protein
MTETAKVISISETQEVEQEALALPEKARLIVVDSNEGMAMADQTVNDIGLMIKKVDGVYAPLAKSAFENHRKVTGDWNKAKKPLEDAKDYLVGQVKTYQRNLREAAEAEQRRLAEIARKEEEERRLAEAAQAEAEGNHEEAEAIIKEEIYVPTPVVKVETPKVDNRKYATRQRARVVNKMAIIQAVAKNPALQDLIDINTSAANNKAKALGKELSRVIPGLEYYEE